MQHPRAIDGSMDYNTETKASNNTGDDTGPSQPLPPSDSSARYRFIYDDICRYCAEMWANIASMRSRSVEHTVFSGSLLGILLAFAATSDNYTIGWWGLASIVVLSSVTLPHLLIVMTVPTISESRLRKSHANRPTGEPELQIIAELENKAETLNKKSAAIGRAYIRARNWWLIGVAACIILGVIEWLL